MKTPKHFYSKECYCPNCLERRVKDDLLTAIARLIRYLETKHEYEGIAQKLLDRYKVFNFADLKVEDLEKIIVYLSKQLNEVKNFAGV